MQTGRQLTVDRLLRSLARQPARRASDLASEIGVSIPTLHRMLQQLEPQVVTAGKARRARYALRRPLRGGATDYPLYAIDETGTAEQIATLIPVSREGSWMLLPSHWPVPEEARDGWWAGLPYPFYDMRPQGYMGRQFALQEHQQLAVPSNPEEWTDDDILYALSQRGSDVSGNLIFGQTAYERWLQTKVAAPPLISETTVGTAYTALATKAVNSGIAGSSAAGEFPKFSALRELPEMATPHVLVEFSGADGSSAVRRWADLLICEHLALECIRLIPGIESASSRIVQDSGRTFLELERFDRHGLFGRSPICSLSTLNAALLGASSTDWVMLAGRLNKLELLSPEALEQISCIWWFGKLIGNTDMHLGNLSFRMGPSLSLAPIYDMLPMLYAPLAGGEVPVRELGSPPPLPLPPQRPVWLLACEAAIFFWGTAAQDLRISENFREICTTNQQQLQTWRTLA